MSKKATPSQFLGDQDAQRSKRRPARGLLVGGPADGAPLVSRVARKAVDAAQAVRHAVVDAAKEVIDLQEIEPGRYASHPIVQAGRRVIRLDRSASPISAEMSTEDADRLLAEGAADIRCGYCTESVQRHRAGCPVLRLDFQTGCSSCGRKNSQHDSDCNTALKAIGFSEDEYQDLGFEPRLGRDGGFRPGDGL